MKKWTLRTGCLALCMGAFLWTGDAMAQAESFKSDSVHKASAKDRRAAEKQHQKVSKKRHKQGGDLCSTLESVIHRLTPRAKSGRGAQFAIKILTRVAERQGCGSKATLPDKKKGSTFNTVHAQASAK